jgi:tetratricopeptide (TPR) repeat protein
VESVAWVSERKDLLSTMFGLLAISAYVEYARSRKAGTYALCLMLFGVGLMAKPMLITLPFVLLPLDYWPLQRMRRAETDIPQGAQTPHLLLEKLPLAGLSLMSVVITYLAQKQGGAMPADSSVLANAGNAVISYAAYILKMFWPARLAVFYPFDPAAITAGRVALSLGFITAITAGAIRAARSRPWLAVGWLWYLGTLVPVIGFIRIGQQALSDRYTYIPLIGLFIMAIWGMAELAELLRMPRSAQAAIMIAILAACSLLTFRQAGTWHDSTTLFSRALDVTDNNWLAHKNLASALANRGEFDQALRHVSESLRIKPDAPEYVSQGWLSLKLGQPALALESSQKALAMEPGNAKAHFMLGLASITLKDYRSALAELETLKGLNSPYAAQLLDSLNAAGISPPGNRE